MGGEGKGWTECRRLGKPGPIRPLESLQFFLFKFQGSCHLYSDAFS